MYPQPDDSQRGEDIFEELGRRRGQWSAGLDTRIQRSVIVAASGPVIQESLKYGNSLVGTEWD